MEELVILTVSVPTAAKAARAELATVLRAA